MDSTQLAGAGFRSGPEEQVLRLARLALGCGIDGLVCSADETSTLRHELGAAPFLVVPGIRPAGTDRGDQRRVATPREAIARGASLLVVGRPITQAACPADAARAVLAEIAA
jgi:orotidine-5'-phosphate decarboxylase